MLYLPQLTRFLRREAKIRTILRDFGGGGHARYCIGLVLAFMHPIMDKRTGIQFFCLFGILFGATGLAAPRKQQNQILWQNPADIRSRNLLRGPEIEGNLPQEPFTFLKEEMDGTNPKFDVVDRDGVKWRVKLGVEARPEVAASRLLWAIGYFTRENYYLPVLRVENMPKRLKRGQELIASNGEMYGVRLRRESGVKKTGSWRWRHNPFTGTRELNGLRIMMALLNNGDLKDQNNGIFRKKGAGAGASIYMVSDLGGSFSEHVWPIDLKGQLHYYRQSRFLQKAGDDTADFEIHSQPMMLDLARLPWYIWRLRLRWIGKGIPRSDSEWVGKLLAQLSPDQISDAFRAAGYSPDEVQGFTEALRARIAQLSGL